MTKSRKSRTKPVKDLPTKKVAIPQAKGVRGGAFEVYLNFKGQKQGAIDKK